MMFIMAKPSENMTFGDLFYSQANYYGNEIELFGELNAFCKDKAKEEFLNNPKMMARVQNELNVIENKKLYLPFQIVKEIAALSKENGYPVTTFGEESGSIIMYLLGVSNIAPWHYDSTTDLYVENSVLQNISTLTIAIAEPIREMIQSRLNEKFGFMNTSKSYGNIHIPPYALLTEIGELSKKTGFDYNSIQLDDKALIHSVYSDIYQELFGEDYTDECELNLTDLARLYAYNMCSHNHTKSKAWFEKLKAFIFADDIFEFAVKMGCDFETSRRFTRQSLWMGDKWEEIEKDTAEKISKEFVSVYDELKYVWPKTCCLSRINPALMRKFYKLNYPEEYKSICENSDD